MIGFKTPHIMPPGWTPLVWEQNMRRQTGELHVFSRCCAWMDDVRAIDVRLCDEPLYGRTLPQVACLPEADVPEKQADSASPSRSAFNVDFPVRKREERPAVGMRAPAKREKAAPPSGLERKVSREKLLHNAGDIKTPAGKSAASMPPVPELNINRSVPPVAPSLEKHQRWLGGMMERAERSIGRTEEAVSALEKPECAWKHSLDGITVSRDVLMALANGTQPSAENPKAAEKRLPQPDSSTGLAELSAPEWMRETRPAVQPTPADEEPMSKAIAPPISTPSLMALLTPQRVYQPPLPVASTAIQNGARQEAEDSNPPDLTALAAQIKRILDEEARRHGIPV